MNNRHGKSWSRRVVGGLVFIAFGPFSNLMIEDARGAESHSDCRAEKKVFAAPVEGDAAEKVGLSEDEWKEVVKLLNTPPQTGTTRGGVSVASLQAQDDRELLLNLLPALPTRALMASLSILPYFPDEGRGGVSVKAARHVPAMSRMRVEALER